MSVLQSSRRQHDRNIESVFAGPLKTLREHIGPYALQTCYKQMELSMYYKTEVLQLPEGMYNWVSTAFIYFTNQSSECCIKTEYAVQIDEETGYDWIDGEEKVSPGSRLGGFTSV